MELIHRTPMLGVRALGLNGECAGRRDGGMDGGGSTVPDQCPTSARPVPDTVPDTVPDMKTQGLGPDTLIRLTFDF